MATIEITIRDLEIVQDSYTISGEWDLDDLIRRMMEALGIEPDEEVLQRSHRYPEFHP